MPWKLRVQSIPTVAAVVVVVADDSELLAAASSWPDDDVSVAVAQGRFVLGL